MKLQYSKFINILKNVLDQDKTVVIEKLLHKFFDKKGSITLKDNLNWIKLNCTNFKDFAINKDKDLWLRSEKFSELLKNRAQELLLDINDNLGGGGIYPLLYFLTIKYKPQIILETGVAAGYSSNAFLTALHENKSGILYSSDLPYFRGENTKETIGILVEKDYKYKWRIFLKGDHKNIENIKKEITTLDIFHYDSDKSYIGREKTFKRIKPLLKNNSILIIDDIQDNCFFYDFLSKEKIKKWHIFKFENKYCGLIYYKD